MKVAHVLRKYNPAEWGGTETAVKRLIDGLQANDVVPIVYAPKLQGADSSFDPIAATGCLVNRFKAFVPVCNIPEAQRQQLIAVGGNLMSFELFTQLMTETGLSVIHTHAGNRLGGIALTVAKLKRIPLIASIHGGVLDLPKKAQEFLRKPLEGGIEWGKIFGIVLRSRRVLAEADAIVTCNKREAELQQQQYPRKRVIIQPHGIPAADYAKDCREAARKAFPQIVHQKLLLVVGRIDPVKNQSWAVTQAPSILAKHPDAIIAFVGSCTDPAYGKMLEKKIQELGLEHRIILAGGLPPGDARLVGLFQEAKAVLLPSVSETFGLVILESWAAGTTVISSRTSGASDLIKHEENGWIFDLEHPNTFHQAINAVFNQPSLACRTAEAGRKLVQEKYDVNVLGAQMKRLYEELIAERK